MKKTLALITGLTIYLGGSLMAQPKLQKNSTEKRVYYTNAIQGKAPILDGNFDEECWNQVEWSGSFIQRVPYEGQAPSQETAFKILYDSKFLYIAFRCFDKEPENIVRRMSRRDGFEGDWVEINIDSYNDKRTAFSFTSSVSGVKGDEFISNNGSNWDANWNPIWFLRTKVDSIGWTAEVKIPLSQIRYGNAEEHVWGLQFTRRDFRKDSRSTWQFISQNDPNWVSNFGELRGIKGIKPQKQIELQPYVVAKAETFARQEGNPFADGKDQSVDIGLDGKFGVTSDLTLDFTINPDFGQVEADPSALNLNGFRIFFPEQRPFFIENRNLFDYQITAAQAGGNFTSDNLFYSRRIGRAPHGYPSLSDGEYAEVPGNTSILGAAKFSGKTKKGLGIGILESITAREFANIDRQGERRKEIVEPLSNYFVGRLTQDFNEGNTVIGGIFTATNRDLKGTNLNFLHKSAYSGGLDLVHWMKERTYILTANFIFSQVNGSPESILNTQTSFEHYFQRPDAEHLDLDSTATHLNGHGGTLKLSKYNGKLRFDGGITWRSPGLELNDLGFMSNADEVNHFFWGGYQINEPFSIFRRLNFNYNHFLRWDFGGKNLYQAINTNFNTQFTNFWNMGAGVTFEFKDISNNALFGGPSLRQSPGIAQWAWLGTDSRKAIRFNLNFFNAWGIEKDAPTTVYNSNYSLGLTYQPTNATRLSFRPSYSINKRLIQNVSSRTYNGAARYITGEVDQRTLSATIRVNINVSPNLTLQYYGQPFFSRGRYKNFKYITNSLSKNFFNRFHQYQDNQISFNAEEDNFSIDEDADGQTDYSFGNPDFNFRQFRSNFVVRWEYVPGSELFLVWSQNNTDLANPQENLFPGLNEPWFSKKTHNIFLVKATYRFLK